MRTIETRTYVAAPPDVVWDVITDFAAYREWNPFVTALEGEPRVGARLRATFTLPERAPKTFAPTVVVVEPGRQLRWHGRLAIPRLFDADHELAVAPADGGAEFVHREEFRGLLVPLLGKLLAATHRAFVAMDAALASRAESIANVRRA